MGKKLTEQRLYDAKIKSYENAIAERRLELNLFWQRSLFFWGFIASAFIAFAALKDDVLLRLFVACFGFICALTWTLANRGSKYWYEAWEQKVNIVDFEGFDNKLYIREVPIHNASFWSGRRYSVTRLAIGLSDFAVFVWLVLTIITAMRQEWKPINLGAIAAIWGTAAYCFAIAKGGRFSG